MTEDDNHDSSDSEKDEGLLSEIETETNLVELKKSLSEELQPLENIGEQEENNLTTHNEISEDPKDALEIGSDSDIDFAVKLTIEESTEKLEKNFNAVSSNKNAYSKSKRDQEEDEEEHNAWRQRFKENAKKREQLFFCYADRLRERPEPRIERAYRVSKTAMQYQPTEADARRGRPKPVVYRPQFLDFYDPQSLAHSSYLDVWGDDYRQWFRKTAKKRDPAKNINRAPVETRKGRKNAGRGKREQEGEKEDREESLNANKTDASKGERKAREKAISKEPCTSIQIHTGEAEENAGEKDGKSSNVQPSMKSKKSSRILNIDEGETKSKKGVSFTAGNYASHERKTGESSSSVVQLPVQVQVMEIENRESGKEFDPELLKYVHSTSEIKLGTKKSMYEGMNSAGKKSLKSKSVSSGKKDSKGTEKKIKEQPKKSSYEIVLLANKSWNERAMAGATEKEKRLPDANSIASGGGAKSGVKIPGRLRRDGGATAKDGDNK